MIEKNVHFKTNILLKNIIGKDLITNDNIAVLELVKNAYDAGSPSVEINFVNVYPSNNDQQSSIIICDKGSGMNYDGLINRWLNIAYSEKKEQTWMYGRRQAGNKGVGRFSCDKLGSYLSLYTKTETEKCLSIDIDWSLFENDDSQNKEIQDISLKLKEIDISTVLSITGWDNFEHGTILKISGLREFWNADKILSLKRDLEKFIDPNQAFMSNAFSIQIKAPDFEEYDNHQVSEISCVNGLIKNRIFERLDFKTSKISSIISDDGLYITTTIEDRGREVFQLKEKNVYHHLKNIKIILYYLNPYSKTYFSKQTGFRSVEYGSIFLFVNGFRVPPYGDQGDDWLGIERRKTLGYRRYLSTREIIGRIEIIDNSNNFQIITSRSGIVNNEAFFELSKEGSPYGYFYRTLRRFERFVVDGIKWDRTGDILSSNNNGDEKYRMDDLSRDKQIISIIKKIIDTSDSEIIDLHINDSFIEELLKQQMANTQASINSLLQKLSIATDSLTKDDISSIRNQIQNDSNDVNKLFSILYKITPYTNNLSDIQSMKGQIAQVQNELERKTIELESEIAEKEKALELLRISQRELEIEREKNTYLLSSERSMSEDAKGMVHNIKLIALTIRAAINNIINEVNSKSTTQEQLLSRLSTISFQNSKSLKICKLITRANFRADKEEKYVDIIQFIKQYVNIYKDVVPDSLITIHYKPKDLSYKRKISILDISIIIDNLLSNSQKAGATLFSIDPHIIDNHLELIVSDNGIGLSPIFKDFPNKIFELGVTTTDGSGIGLFSVKQALIKLGGDIEYINQKDNSRGASFRIIL